MARTNSIDGILRQLDDIGARADALAARGKAKVRDPRGKRATAVSEARELHVGSAMLAGSVLFDSAIEHYRGSFKNPAMWLALAAAGTSLAAGIDGAVKEENASEPLRDAAYIAAATVGVIGTGFHVYNVTKRTGGLTWNNAFYAAPMGAPAALILSGLLGYGAERVRDAAPFTKPRILGMPAGRLLSGLTAVGLLGTTAEAWLLHFRGNFQNKAMYLPVTLPPSAAAVVAATTLMPHPIARSVSRVWLAAVAVMGFVGVGFHINGVARMMGGWKNWSQNMIDGPPIPAPPSFSGLAVAGMAALRLLGNKG